jgi:malate dehydrogenase (oxaloacetate-decarboxylating)
MNYAQLALAKHLEHQGKITIQSKVSLNKKEDLAIYYTPGVAAVSNMIAENPEKSFDYTWRHNTIAIVSDGSAVLGLGNIGPEAALPVMEGKAAIFREFAGVNAVPICIKTQDEEEIINLVKNLAPTFGGINLEDIKAPKCFAIEKRLSEELAIPVFHDDQHGTAIAVLAGLINALKLAGKELQSIRIVFSGAGAAGIATCKLLVAAGARDLVLVDSRGAIYPERDHLNPAKAEIAQYNRGARRGSLKDVVVGSDVFIGVSVPGVLNASDIALMNQKPIIMAMANPEPEIDPQEAKKAGAFIVATGRSDYPNQVNNALVFPGIFRGALQKRVHNFTPEIYIKVAKALAEATLDLKVDNILPPVFQKDLSNQIAMAI